MTGLSAKAARKAARRAARDRQKVRGREYIVKAIVTVIREDRDNGITPTLLNHEGALVASLRAGLCLGGMAWAVANETARDVVNEAFQKAGAKRPAWKEGQPEHCDGGVIRWTRTTCRNCSKGLADDQTAYCSKTCFDAHRARLHRGTTLKECEQSTGCGGRNVPDKIEVVDAWCRWCGDPLPEKEDRHARRVYCSRRCKDDDRNAQRREAWLAALETRPCLHCRETFRQNRANQVYCSMRCGQNAAYRRRTGRPIAKTTKTCRHCGETFDPNTLAQVYCGDPCRIRAHLERKRTPPGALARLWRWLRG